MLPDPYSDAQRTANAQALAQAPGHAINTSFEAEAGRYVFRVMAGLHNNGAAWLGANRNLTRLKLEGGMESMLRVNMNWQQFGKTGGEGGRCVTWRVLTHALCQSLLQIACLSI